MRPTHYIGMNGTHGCLPDSCNVYSDYDSAVESLESLLDLTGEQTEELRDTGSVECTREQGAEYAEISECTCEEPHVHQDSETEAEFRDNWPEMYRELVTCDQCSMLAICGVACHEIGCPNMGARWDIETQSWIKQRECFECGCTVDKNELCCSEEEEIPSGFDSECEACGEHFVADTRRDTFCEECKEGDNDDGFYPSEDELGS